jgi:acyl-CoA dehydrogenase
MTATAQSLCFDPGEEVGALVDGIAELCRRFPDEYWAEHDAASEYPREFVDAVAAGGWLGLTVPEEFGGGGLGYVAGAAILRAIASSGAGLNGCIPVHMSMFAAAPVVEHGSQELKATFLPRIVAGDSTLCFLVSEPDTGSDTSRLRTRATRTEDGWSGSGQKIWITQALEADIGILLARTSEAAGRFDGMSLFLIDMVSDAVSVQSIPKLPHNALRSCEVFISDLAIPRERLIGEEGQGFKQVLGGLNSERVLMAAEMVGIGEAALRRAAQYGREREVFGRPIGANQAISHPLARAEALLASAWLTVLEAAWTMDSGAQAGAAANRAKYLAAEACWAAADAAMQTYGGMGFAKEAHVERYFREARLLRTAPVSQEMALNYLSQKVLDLPRSY